MLKQKSRGVTLVEVMMVLGVLAILLGLLMSILGMVQTNQKSNEMLQELYLIKQQTISLCSGTEDTCKGEVDISATIAKANVLPRRYVSSDGNTLKDVYGGPLEVAYLSAKDSSTLGYASEELIEFGIIMNNKTECTNIIEAMGQGPLSAYITRMGQDWSNATQAVSICSMITFPGSFSAFF